MMGHIINSAWRFRMTHTVWRLLLRCRRLEVDQRVVRVVYPILNPRWWLPPPSCPRSRRSPALKKYWTSCCYLRLLHTHFFPLLWPKTKTFHSFDSHSYDLRSILFPFSIFKSKNYMIQPDPARAKRSTRLLARTPPAVQNV